MYSICISTLRFSLYAVPHSFMKGLSYYITYRSFRPYVSYTSEYRYLEDILSQWAKHKIPATASLNPA